LSAMRIAIERDHCGMVLVAVVSNFLSKTNRPSHKPQTNLVTVGREWSGLGAAETAVRLVKMDYSHGRVNTLPWQLPQQRSPGRVAGESKQIVASF